MDELRAKDIRSAIIESHLNSSEYQFLSSGHSLVIKHNDHNIGVIKMLNHATYDTYDIDMDDPTMMAKVLFRAMRFWEDKH